MKACELSDTLGYKTVVPPREEAVINEGYTSDLLSDVMGNAPDGSVLITIQGHKNTVAVASLAGIVAIVLCNTRSAPEDMQEAALKEGVAIYSTSENQFTVSYRIARLLGKY